MNFDEYQNLTRKTAGTFSHKDEAIKAWALGIGGESGEVLEEIKKKFYHAKPLQMSKITNELGDLLWYIARLADELEIPLSQIANTNIEKLKLRYPEGFRNYEERLSQEKEFGSH